MEINSTGCPSSEYSIKFIEGMIKRMAASYSKYGLVKDAYPHKVNALESMQVRLDKYRNTGNLEWLIDAANFLMIEFMYLSIPNSYFKATESNESPGRVAYDNNFELTSKDNKELSDEEFRRLEEMRKQ